MAALASNESGTCRVLFGLTWTAPNSITVDLPREDRVNLVTKTKGMIMESKMEDLLIVRVRTWRRILKVVALTCGNFLVLRRVVLSEYAYDPAGKEFTFGPYTPARAGTV